MGLDKQTDSSWFKIRDERERNNQGEGCDIFDGEAARAVELQKVMDLGD